MDNFLLSLIKFRIAGSQKSRTKVIKLKISLKLSWKIQIKMSFQFYESKVFSGILHIIAISQLFYAMNFDWNLNIPDTPGVPKMLRHGYGGRSRFLTYWCLVSIIDRTLAMTCPTFFQKHDFDGYHENNIH